MRSLGSSLLAVAAVLSMMAAAEGMHLLAAAEFSSADGGTTTLPSSAGPPLGSLNKDIATGGRRLLSSDGDSSSSASSSELVDVGCDLSDSTPSDFQFQTQWTCKDPTLKTIRDVSLTECQAECTCRSLCGAFSFNAEREDCYLKAECVLGEFDDEDISGFKGSAQPPAGPPAYVYYSDQRCANPTTIRILWDQTFLQCEQACSSTPGCLAYSRKTWGKCELQSSCDQLVSDSAYSTARLETSGEPPAGSQFADFSNAVYLPGSYCADPTIKVLWDKSRPQCESACASTWGCQAFSLRTWGKCELKESCEAVVPDPAFDSVKAEMRSSDDSNSSEDDSSETADSESEEASEEESVVVSSEADSDEEDSDSQSEPDEESSDADGLSWGSVSFSGQTGAFAECRDDPEDEDNDFGRYFCDSAHCVINCEGALGIDGLLVDADWKGMAYCDSVHTADRYGDEKVCCCGERVSSSGPKATIPCLIGGEDEVEDSCYYWCRVRSYQGWDNCAGDDYLCLPSGTVLSQDTCEEYEEDNSYDYEIHDIECGEDGQCCNCYRFS